MKNLKIYSEIFLWTGRIFFIALIGLIIFLRLVAVPTNSWSALHETELVGVVNILIIMAPFSLILGHTIKEIYTQLNRINNKL